MKINGWAKRAKRVWADVKWIRGWARTLAPLCALAALAMACGGSVDPSQEGDAGAAQVDPQTEGCGAIEYVDGQTVVLPAPCAIYDAGAGAE